MLSAPASQPTRRSFLRGAYAFSLASGLLSTSTVRAMAQRTVSPPDGDAVEAIFRWNAGACRLVANSRWNPLQASRYYAYLALAQLKAAYRERDDPSVCNAVSRASASITSGLFGAEREALVLALQLGGQCGLAGSRLDQLGLSGEGAAEEVWALARIDGAGEQTNALALPDSPGFWFSAPWRDPLLPRWGRVAPLTLGEVAAFMPRPPPPLHSREFREAMEELRTIARDRTSERLRIAKFWSDGLGTPTPPGHWNEIAQQLLREHSLPVLAMAGVLTTMNAAMMDAGIVCWAAKHGYMLARPSQLDPEITLAIDLPNFPAYPSGHASFSGAASEVLARFFPAKAVELRQMAEEAALSRVYAGIHYRFDGTAGLELGHQVATAALSWIERSPEGQAGIAEWRSSLDL